MNLNKKLRIIGYWSSIYLALAVFMVLFFTPVVWMISSAFKSKGELFILPPRWIPDQPTWENFKDIVVNPVVIRFYLNSVIVAIGTVIVSLSVGILGGYSFSRFSFRGSRVLLLSILSSQMFPVVLFLIALYITFRKLNLLNTYYALILTHSSLTVPFTIWILKGFFDTIPRELEEAAYIDGCGRFQALYRVILPLILPGLVATAIYSFLLSWNDFALGLTLNAETSMQILGPGIALTYMGEFEYEWGTMMALSFLVAAPLVITFIFLQKLFIKGLTAGAIKG